MVRKPAKMYRYIKGQQAYTRREYMGGVPHSRITQFDLGNVKGEFNTAVDLIVKEECQIRHNALEAARIAATRFLHRRVGSQNFHLKIRVQPHHVLRENKLATGAGADRVSQGMRHAFGKAVGTAARVKRGQKVITVYIDESRIDFAKEAMRRAGMKFPTPVKIVVNKLGGVE